MSELLSQLQQLGDGEIDDLSIAHDASEEIVALRLRVAELVEALTELCDEIDNHDIHSAISKTNILWFKRKARAAMAAYRKQKENK